MKTIHEKLEHLIKMGNYKKVPWFAFNCAKSVAHLSKDARVATALLVLEKYLLEQATLEELEEARTSATHAAYVANYAKDAAAGAAADAVKAACNSAANTCDTSDAVWAAAYAAYANAALVADDAGAAVQAKQHAELDALLKDSE